MQKEPEWSLREVIVQKIQQMNAADLQRLQAFLLEMQGATACEAVISQVHVERKR